VRDTYISAVSNRLNEVMKRLTLLATVFLPLTFVTGFFGQNFGWLTDNVSNAQSFFLLGLGLLLASVFALWIWFKRSDFM
jgi:magnesium transporter